MKKKLAVGILSVAILAAGATAAFGATDSTKLGEIKDLYHQMFSIQKQIVDKEVEAGVITSDQATAYKNAIDQRSTFHDQAIDNGQAFGPGAGMMGGGMRGGMGMMNNGQPLTQEQIDAWNQLREERQKLHDEAVQNGTITPGQGYGRRGGMGGGWGYQAPAAAPTTQSNTTSN
jgi:polyhydroxyalkanoate synthesis regulator phasin